MKFLFITVIPKCLNMTEKVKSLCLTKHHTTKMLLGDWKYTSTHSWPWY